MWFNVLCVCISTWHDGTYNEEGGEPAVTRPPVNLTWQKASIIRLTRLLSEGYWECHTPSDWCSLSVVFMHVHRGCHRRRPLTHLYRHSVLLFELELQHFLCIFLRKKKRKKKKKKNVKMNILTPIRSSKYFFQIRGSQTFPCQGPPKLHVFGRRPPSRKRSFRGRPEAKIWVTKVSFEKYIFKDLKGLMLTLNLKGLLFGTQYRLCHPKLLRPLEIYQM